MARGDDWSREEVDATVADYLDMLTAELRGQGYNKAAHRRALLQRLDGRTNAAVEFKHQNISAVLTAMGHPIIAGYKPAWNWQSLLAESVASRVAASAELAIEVSRAADGPAEAPRLARVLDRLDARPPKLSDRADGVRETTRAPLLVPRAPVDWLRRESQNRSLGEAGESFVMEFERARLQKAGRDDLADRIEQISKTIGDGEGFDVRSFEGDGTDRLIEVKTTSWCRETPFYLTKNEVDVSRVRKDRYHLYRVYAFRSDPRLFTVCGAMDRVCRLDPQIWRAQIA